MKYIYAALLLHAAGQKIDENNIKKILTSTGGEIEEARVKALVATLSEIDIDEALKTVSTVVAPVTPAPTTAPVSDQKEEEEKEEEKEEEALAGLGALFQ